MKPGARGVAPLGGAALLSVTLLLGASPTAAIASPAPVSESPATMQTQDDVVGPSSTQDTQGASPAPSSASPDAPSEESSPEPSDPVEGLSEDPTEAPLDPTVPGDPTETPAPGPTQPEPTEPDPTEPEPTEPGPTQPEPTQPEPTDPGSTEPDPADPSAPDPVTPEPEPSEEEPPPGLPSDPGEGTSAPAQGEHYLQCGSAFAYPGQTQTLRLQMSSSLSDLTVGSSLTGAEIWIEGGVVYYQAPSPLPPGASQDDFAVRGVDPNGDPVSDRCNIGLASTPGDADDAEQPAPPSQLDPAPGSPSTERPGSATAPSTASSSPSSSAGATSDSRLSGPPIPGMPGYALPGQGSPSSPDSASPTRERGDSHEDPAAAQPAEDSALAATGLSTAQTAIALALALLAILAGAAAMMLASRRSGSAR